MWEENNSRKKLRNIILILLLLVLIAGAFFLYKFISSRNKQREEELKAAYAVQQEQQSSNKQLEVEAVLAEYEKDMDTVAKYMPGIVCWGDKLTTGSSGNASYPKVLQSMIDENICALYDFSSTIENPNDYSSRIKYDELKVKIPVVNMGNGEENCNTILGRCGAVPYVLSESVDIPTGCEPVEVRIQSENGRSVTPLLQGDGGVNNVTIKGIDGVLSLDENSYKSSYSIKYYFTRSEPGTEVLAEAGVPVVTAASEKYLDYIPVIFIGTYGGYDDPTDLIAKITK